MKLLARFIKCVFIFVVFGWMGALFSMNQTATTSPIVPARNLPFRIKIEKDFLLPNGYHSGAEGRYKNKILLIGGRTNGMHTFNQDNPLSNFPPQKQNKVVYVVDLVNKKVSSRSLEDPSSGLTAHQIDLLSVTASQFSQDKEILYITGGYGVDSETGDFSTKDTLTAINVPGLIHWVEHPLPHETAAQYVRTISDPLFQVTGGYMTKIRDTFLLVFGQDFEGLYFDANSTQVYTNQVRRFRVFDDCKHLAFEALPSLPKKRDPSFRRRDLNVVPIVQKGRFGGLVPALVALSGVFTKTEGAWTVPVIIDANGTPSMADPHQPGTFKQGMNNYASACISLYSRDTGNQYITILGGISYGFFSNGVFKTDSDLPFINQITTIRIDERGRFKQYLLNTEYPVIRSKHANRGNRLLFGANAEFLPLWETFQFPNGVLNLDAIMKFAKLKGGSVVIGYIIGGIQSTVPNTKSRFDSAASPHIFKVTLIPKGDCKL